VTFSVEKGESSRSIAGSASCINAANLITVVRLACVPVVGAMLYAPSGCAPPPENTLWAAVVFSLASLTDAVDGFVARRFDLVTKMGQILDPLADKAMVCTALIMMVPCGKVPAWFVAVVVMRDLGVTILRVMALPDGVVIPASPMAKVKTAMLTIGAGAVMLPETYFGGVLFHTGSAVLLSGVVLSVWSGAGYFHRFAGMFAGKA